MFLALEEPPAQKFIHGLSGGWDVMLPALQTLKKLELTMDRCFVGPDSNMLASVPFDLGRFQPGTFKIEQNCSYPNNQALLRFLTCFLSIPSSPSGIEVLETRITWFNVKVGHGKDYFHLVPDGPRWASVSLLGLSL